VQTEAKTLACLSKLNGRAGLYTVWIVWALAVGFGIRELLIWDGTPGAPSNAPQMWPQDSVIDRERSEKTLIMFLHPRCKCSQASLENLARATHQFHSKPHIVIVFTVPNQADGAWNDTALWGAANALSNVRVVADKDGIEARRFGAFTSGETQVYDDDGRLIFSGGITPRRGHVGMSDGLEALTAAINNASHFKGTAAVFGCRLVRS